MIQDKEQQMDDGGLLPIHLFTVLKSDNSKRGIFYIPQMGLGIEGFESDGSVRTVARHIASLSGAFEQEEDEDPYDKYFRNLEGISVKNTSQPQYISFESGVIDPGKLTEESIIKSIVAWMIHGDESELAQADDSADEDGIVRIPVKKESYEEIDNEEIDNEGEDDANI